MEDFLIRVHSSDCLSLRSLPSLRASLGLRRSRLEHFTVEMPYPEGRTHPALRAPLPRRGSLICGVLFPSMGGVADRPGWVMRRLNREVL